MPKMRGPGTYKGYQSPKTSGWPKEIRDEVRHVYGAYREKHPGENPTIKARGSRIAWAAAKKKYPELYRQQLKIQKAAKKEEKEHPWASKKVATRIASDHITKEDRIRASIREKQIHG